MGEVPARILCEKIAQRLHEHGDAHGADCVRKFARALQTTSFMDAAHLARQWVDCAHWELQRRSAQPSEKARTLIDCDTLLSLARELEYEPTPTYALTDSDTAQWTRSKP